MRSPQTAKAAPSIQSCPDLPVHESTVCRDVRQRRTSAMTSLFQSLDLQSHRRQPHAGFGYKPETILATISAAGCGCLASATLCPAP